MSRERERPLPPLAAPGAGRAWWLETVLLLAGVVLLTLWAGAWLQTRAFQAGAAHHLAAITPPGPPPPPPADTAASDSDAVDSSGAATVQHPPGEVGPQPSAGAAPRARPATVARAAGAPATRREIRSTGLVGRVIVPRLGISAVIAEGTSKRVLSRAVGHVTRTAVPGEGGNVGLTAHRDGFFRPLAHVRRGDLVRLETPDGVFRYRVTRTAVVAPRRVSVFDPTTESTVTLVTCWPFRWIGPAPKRFVVWATAETSGPRAAR